MSNVHVAVMRKILSNSQSIRYAKLESNPTRNNTRRKTSDYLGGTCVVLLSRVFRYCRKGRCVTICRPVALENVLLGIRSGVVD